MEYQGLLIMGGLEGLGTKPHPPNHPLRGPRNSIELTLFGKTIKNGIARPIA
jgi:hypothetical protein